MFLKQTGKTTGKKGPVCFFSSILERFPVVEATVQTAL